MSYPRRAGPGPQVNSILKTLQATTMLDNKAVLPGEILVAILDYLPVPDLLRFARTSRRMHEMVYDDTRWVSRLKSMGCWDELEARRRFEEARRRRRETMEKANAVAAMGHSASGSTSQFASQAPGSTMLFDASVEEEKQKKEMKGLRDGFETIQVSAAARNPYEDPEALLQVIKSAKSIRGHAREEYGKIYGSLAPFYFDLVKAKSHADPLVFKVFRDPERQAQMLSNLAVFAKSDWADGWQQREDKLASMTGIFETAVLREFEQGYEFWDVDGRMNKYAHVLHTLNGGTAGVDLFISKHPLFQDREVLSNSMECINQAPADELTLEPSGHFFDILRAKVDEQASVMERIFPNAEMVFWSFLDKVREDIIVEYATPLFDETHERSVPSYLKAVSGIFEQSLHFFRTVKAPKTSQKQQDQKAKELALKLFEPHLDLYLQEESDFFAKVAEEEVAEWEKKLSEQDASVESFYMANFNRQADKKDFLTSFKKVVMMPVTALPTSLGLPLSSPFGSAKTATASSANGPIQRTNSPQPSGSLTPVLVPPERSGSPLPEKAPTDELAAKAALMTSRLEGMKSLFSIEVALKLVHAAQTSLGRVAVFIQLGGQLGGEAREQCESIFVVLLRILGSRHVKPGFDRAVEHLSQYNPREVSDHTKVAVAPLVTFIELVNIGDLISQMIDVFYEQQLAGPKIVDRNDFLDPAGMAKKKFEQMLDESVAAGLNKGIDVLMDEVEYICATEQQPTDYNPSGGESDKRSVMSADLDIGPTATARRIRDLVASHTSMLVGSTEKMMLDVFNGEVGLRLFSAICKHLKRQRVSTEGAIKLIADMNLYFDYVSKLKNADLLAYFRALRELSQIYLIDAKHAKEMATIIADRDRFGGIFQAEEVYEYAERRADWYQVRRNVEKAMYGLECSIM